MRVKLSYTVDEEDVLAEAAKIINLSADDLQQAISLFTEIQKELKGEKSDDDSYVNVHRCFEMMDEFREALYNVDTRLNEVTEIVKGYDEYQRRKKHDDSVSMGETIPAHDENPHMKGIFGAD